MTGIMLTPIEPLVKEALEEQGCIKWLASDSKNLTPITSFMSSVPVVQEYKTKSSERFKITSENWKQDIAESLKMIYSELPDFKFSAIVHDSDTEDFTIVTRVEGTKKTLFRHAKVKYIKSFQNPDVYLTEIL